MGCFNYIGYDFGYGNDPIYGSAMMEETEVKLAFKIGKFKLAMLEYSEMCLEKVKQASLRNDLREERIWFYKLQNIHFLLYHLVGAYLYKRNDILLGQEQPMEFYWEMFNLECITTRFLCDNIDITEALAAFNLN